MRRLTLLLMFCLCLTGMKAQGKQEVFYVNSFWSNWYVQTGLDMSLQNPYGHDFLGEVFPNGKSFGLNVAMGKWITPVLSLRGRVNWENGIKLLKNGHDNWLAPFDQPGKNMDKGGYLTVVGDIQIDLHNLIWGYREDRLWNMQVYPRAGSAYNFGVSKGTPLVGLGIGNTFKLNDQLGLTLMWLTIWFQVDLLAWRRIREQAPTATDSLIFRWELLSISPRRRLLKRWENNPVIEGIIDYIERTIYNKVKHHETFLDYIMHPGM